jgi:Zn ribbon nucleic-acid-binding protein
MTGESNHNLFLNYILLKLKLIDFVIFYDYNKTMQNTYTLPRFNASAFHCPSCGVYATQQWHLLNNIPTMVSMAVCEACDKISLWVNKKIVYPPNDMIPPPHAQMPPQVYNYYNIARSLSLSSAPAAAAYLREALRQLFMHLGAKGENSNDDINFLIGKNLGSRRFYEPFIRAKVWGPYTYKPLKIYESDDETMVELLFFVTNALIEEAIASPATLAEFYAKLSDPRRESKPPVIDSDFFERP